MKEAVRQFKETIELRSSLVSRLKSHPYVSIALLAGAVLIVCCFQIWQRVEVIERSKEVSQLRKTNDILRDNLKKTSAAISELSMASRIEQYAVDSLGMKAISAEQLFTLIPREQESVSPDELTVMAMAIKRVSNYLPVISRENVNAGELRMITIDSGSGEK